MKNFTKIILIVFMAGFIYNCASGVNPLAPPEEPKIRGLMPPDSATVMEKYYIDKFYHEVNQIANPGHEGHYGAVRDVWFDLEELKAYIKYVEEYAAYEGHTGLGLRVYLGAKDETDPSGKRFARQTVFFVPTAKVMGKPGIRLPGINKGPIEEEISFALENLNIKNMKRLNYGSSGYPDTLKSSGN